MNPSGWAPIGPSCMFNGQTGYRKNESSAPVSGRATAIALDPTDPDHVVYVGTASGGVWKSVDGGLTWTPKSDFEASLAIGALAINSADPNNIWAGTGEGNDASADAYFGYGVLVSQDGGDTWQLKNDPLLSGTRINALALDPQGADPVNLHVIVGCTKGLIANMAVVCADTSDSLSASVFRPASPPGNWPPPAPPPGNWAPLHFTETLSMGNYNQVIAMHPSKPETIFVGEARLWRTTDSGLHWDIISNPHSDSPGIHADQHALVFHPADPDKIWVANDGGIWYSKDGGDTWTHRNRGLQTMQYHSLAQHPLYESILLGGTQDNGTQRFLGHPSWEKVRGGDGFIVGIDPSKPNVWYASYIYRTKYAGPGAREASPFDTQNLSGFWRSDESGKPGSFSLKVQGLRNDDTPVSIFWAPFVIDPTPQGPGKPHLVYMGTTKVYWTDNAGDLWQPLLDKSNKPFSTGSVNDNLIAAMAVAPSNPAVLYVSTSDGKFWRLERQPGGLWDTQDLSTGLPAQSYLADIAVDPTDADKVYVGIGSSHGTSGNAPAVAGGRIFRRDAAGIWVGLGTAELNLTITGVTISHTTNPVNAILIDPDHSSNVYIACDVGIFKSTNSGDNWEAFNQTLPNVATIDLQFHKPSRLLRAATSGRSVWERSADVAPPAVSGVDLYVRDSVVDLGRRKTPSDVDDPLDPTVKDHWWTGADVKIDTPLFAGLGLQTPASTVDYQEDSPIDYIGFQQLTYRHPRKGSTSKVYVEVVNRGPVTATNVVVRAFWAAKNADNTYPDLPPDFWQQFPADSSDTAVWKPIGDKLNIPAIPPGEARVSTWDWEVPMGAPDPVGILAIADSTQDPVGENRFQVQPIASENKRVALREAEVSFPVAEVVVGVLLTIGVAAAIGYGISKA